MKRKRCNLYISEELIARTLRSLRYVNLAPANLTALVHMGLETLISGVEAMEDLPPLDEFSVQQELSNWNKVNSEKVTHIASYIQALAKTQDALPADESPLTDEDMAGLNKAFNDAKNKLESEI